MKKFLFYLVQFTWALPQNLVGGIGFLALRKKYKHERFNNAFVTYVPHDNFGGVSLGIFIFMNPDRPADRVHDTRMHEYGHTIQSLLLGPLWAFVRYRRLSGATSPNSSECAKRTVYHIINSTAKAGRTSGAERGAARTSSAMSSRRPAITASPLPR